MPLDRIADYYGEKVGFYFLFLSHYATRCVESNHWFGGSPPNFRTLELGHIEVDSADVWTNRLLSLRSRSTAEERRIRIRAH